MSRLFVLLLALALGACAGAGRGPGASGPVYPGLSCVPFARALTGLALSGDAADWWEEADGRYLRARRPAVGSVLVLARSSRLPHGHVAVVSRVLDRRRIRVIQANWVPGELDLDQLVVDVSFANDWRAVRVWYPPVGQLGAHVYAAEGFILPAAPLAHDLLAARAEPAARAALGD
jgi:surface antigen